VTKAKKEFNFQMIGGKNESMPKVRKIVDPLFLSGTRKEKSCHVSKAPLSM
jgi:hypothetical protein